MGMAELPSPVSVNNMKREKGQCLQGFMLNWSEHWTVAPGAGGSSPLVHPKMTTNLYIVRSSVFSNLVASPKTRTIHKGYPQSFRKKRQVLRRNYYEDITSKLDGCLLTNPPSYDNFPIAAGDNLRMRP